MGCKCKGRGSNPGSGTAGSCSCQMCERREGCEQEIERVTFALTSGSVEGVRSNGSSYNGRSSHRAVRLCNLPTPSGGLAARRTIARAACRSSLSPLSLPLRAEDFCETFRPSSWLRSSWSSPSSSRRRSSLMLVMGSG
eukprot:782297-Prymnesium_polylepis.4